MPDEHGKKTRCSCAPQAPMVRKDATTSTKTAGTVKLQFRCDRRDFVSHGERGGIMTRRALLLLIVLGLIACGRADSGGSGGPASSAAPGKLKIAVIPKGTTHEFWKSVHAGAEKASQELGVQIFWKGPLKE